VFPGGNLGAVGGQGTHDIGDYHQRQHRVATEDDRLQVAAERFDDLQEIHGRTAEANCMKKSG